MEVKIPEVDGYKIINGKHENGVVMLTGVKGIEYTLFIFRFDDDYKDYHCRIEEDIDLSDPNFTVLDNGICVFINPAEHLELFLRDPANGDVAEYTDNDINSTMRLCKSGTSVRFFQGNKLYSIKKK